MTTLQPRGRQPDIIYFDATRHQVVLGTAGTGKSTMAMLRAAYLGHPTNPHSGRVLLVTYNNALVAYLRHLAPVAARNVEVRTYHHFARGYLKSRGLMPYWNCIAKPWQRRSLMLSAISTVASRRPNSKFFQRDVSFFLDEIAWISDMGIESLSEYLAVERYGRKRGLDDVRREIVWEIMESYRTARNASRLIYDWHDISTAVRLELESDHGPRMYRHVIIDEGQDLSPEAIRSLVSATPSDGSVTFFGDYHQQIYGQGLSWRSCGLSIREVDKFRDNYRNTAEIARVAIAMSNMPHMAGEREDLVEPIEPRAAGPLPTLVRCRNEAEEVSVVRAQAEQFGQSGTVAVLVRTWELARRACGNLVVKALDSDIGHWDSKPGVYCGAYHSAKGLEFDAVIMPFCSTLHVPHQDVLATFGAEEAATREGRLLYVGATRARTDLIVTYSGTLTHLLPVNTGLWAEVEP